VIAASYLFGCGGHAAGAAVDAVDDPGRYLEVAAAMGLQLRYVIDTHVHADHLSVGPELATAAGAEYVLHASAGALFPFHPVETAMCFNWGMSRPRYFTCPAIRPSTWRS